MVGLTKKLQSTKGALFTVNCGVGQYIYYACPATYSVPSFNVGGFDGGFSEVSIFGLHQLSGFRQVLNYGKVIIVPLEIQL